ncbi:MAG TPA: phage holin family protein [Caulobacteraceae bacterium]
MILLVRFVVSALALWLAAQVVPGVAFSDAGSLVLATVLLGIANAVVRPVLTIVSFPLTVLTFGLFLLVVNAAVIGLVAMLLDGFTVDGFGAGVGAAIVTGLVSWGAGLLLREDRGRD